MIRIPNLDRIFHCNLSNNEIIRWRKFGFLDEFVAEKFFLMKFWNNENLEHIYEMLKT